MNHIQTLLLICAIILLHFIVHDFAHAVTAKLLGYDIIVGLNIVTLDNQIYQTRADAMLVSISGPIITIMIGLYAAFISNKKQSLIAFWVVLTATCMRLLAQLVSFSNPNDEMRVSIDLGLGSWTLPAISVAILVFATVWAWKGPKPRPFMFFIAWLGISIGFSIVVFGDRVLPKIYW